MRRFVPLAFALLLAGCAAAPAQQGGFSSHYFRQPVGEEPAPPPRETAEAPRAATKPAAAEPAADTYAATYREKRGFSSHYYKQALTADEIAAKLETQVLTLVSQERHRIDPNAKPLTLDPELAEVARAHSEDMAKKDYVAHANAEGDTTATMIMAKDAKFRGLLGENIASQNYDKDASIDLDALAQGLLDSWLASANHKANLAYALYERTGIGIAVNSHTIYATQLFATDLGLPEPPDDPPPAAIKLKPPAAGAPRGN